MQNSIFSLSTTSPETTPNPKVDFSEHLLRNSWCQPPPPVILSIFNRFHFTILETQPSEKQLTVFSQFLFPFPAHSSHFSLTTWNQFCSLDCLQAACTVTLSCRQSTGVFLLVCESVCVCCGHVTEPVATQNILHDFVSKSESKIII